MPDSSETTAISAMTLDAMRIWSDSQLATVPDVMTITSSCALAQKTFESLA